MSGHRTWVWKRKRKRTRSHAMCEQIIKYDCGHLARKRVLCAKRPSSATKRSSWINCFTSASEFEGDCAKQLSLEPRAMLCRGCFEQRRDGEVYVNSQRATSKGDDQHQPEHHGHGHHHHHQQQQQHQPQHRRHASEMTRGSRPHNILVSHPHFATEEMSPTLSEASQRRSRRRSRSNSRRRTLQFPFAPQHSRSHSTLQMLRREIQGGLNMQPQASSSDESLVCMTARKMDRE